MKKQPPPKKMSTEKFREQSRKNSAAIRGEPKKKELPTTWTTRDGTVMKLVDMEASHLLNVRAMLLRIGSRKRREAAVSFITSTHFDDMPDDVRDEIIDEASVQFSTPTDAWVRERSPIFRAVEAELKRRMVDPKTHRVTEADLVKRLAHLGNDPVVLRTVAYLDTRDELDAIRSDRASREAYDDAMRGESYGDD